MFDDIKEVFTDKYRDNVKYNKFMISSADLFKLHNSSESVDDMIAQLKKIKYAPDTDIKNELII